jgi:hypothetical protein
LQGRITTRGRIEHHYKIFGGVTIVFIEIKKVLGDGTDRLDAIAQIIAEFDGKSGLPPLIHFSTSLS